MGSLGYCFYFNWGCYYVLAGIELELVNIFEVNIGNFCSDFFFGFMLCWGIDLENNFGVV